VAARIIYDGLYWIAGSVLNPQDDPLWLRWQQFPLQRFSLENGPPLSGRILSAGERGLLLFNTLDGSIQLKRWNNVRGIESMP
jgi:hypothetical protein